MLAVSPEPPDRVVGLAVAEGVPPPALVSPVAPPVEAPPVAPPPARASIALRQRPAVKQWSNLRALQQLQDFGAHWLPCTASTSTAGGHPTASPGWQPCHRQPLTHFPPRQPHLSCGMMSAYVGRASGSWAQQRCSSATYSSRPSGGPPSGMPGSRSAGGTSSRSPASTLLTICGGEREQQTECVIVHQASCKRAGPGCRVSMHAALGQVLRSRRAGATGALTIIHLRPAHPPGVLLLAPGQLPAQQLPQDHAKRKHVCTFQLMYGYQEAQSWAHQCSPSRCRWPWPVT